MKQKLTMILIIILVTLFVGCSKVQIATDYTYKNYPNASDCEYSKYLIIEGSPRSYSEDGYLRNESKMFEEISEKKYKIDIKISSYENMEYDSTGKKVNVLRETDTFEFLDTIKVTYRGKEYIIGKSNILELHKMIVINFEPTDKTDNKDSYYILDLGRVKLEIYNFYTDKIIEKTIKIPPLKFKMWLDAYKYHNSLFAKKTNYRETPVYSGWAENYNGELPLINREKKFF